jgi:hypothetical protein
MAEELEQVRAAWSRLAPADVRNLIGTGVPADALTDGNLDVDRLLAEGWTVTVSYVAPPGVAEETHRLAQT